MVRKKKAKKDVYSTDMRRYSVYPTYRRPEENTGQRKISVGDTLRVRVTGQDDDGNPTGRYGGYTVIIEEGEASPGSIVYVRVRRVSGRTVWAEVIQ